MTHLISLNQIRCRGDSVIGAFYCILESDPTKGPWLSLTDDIYPLFECHWQVLCPHRKWENQEFWKKHIQDSLSHKKCFMSGRDTFGQTGFFPFTTCRSPSNPSFFKTFSLIGYWRLKEIHQAHAVERQQPAAKRFKPNEIPAATQIVSLQPQMQPSQKPETSTSAIVQVQASTIPLQIKPQIRPPPAFNESAFVVDFSGVPLHQKCLQNEFYHYFVQFVSKSTEIQFTVDNQAQNQQIISQQSALK